MSIEFLAKTIWHYLLSWNFHKGLCYLCMYIYLSIYVASEIRGDWGFSGWHGSRLQRTLCIMIVQYLIFYLLELESENFIKNIMIFLKYF